MYSDHQPSPNRELLSLLLGMRVEDIRSGALREPRRRTVDDEETLEESFVTCGRRDSLVVTRRRMTLERQENEDIESLVHALARRDSLVLTRRRMSEKMATDDDANSMKNDDWGCNSTPLPGDGRRKVFTARCA